MKIAKNTFVSLILLLFGAGGVLAQSDQQKWVDSVYASLSGEERIGQLFMIEAYSDRDLRHTNELLQWVESYGVGGLMFKTGGPHRQAKLTETLQKAAKVPLFIAIDAEWGLSMRLDSTPVYPWMMTQGALPTSELTYEFGLQLARECRAVGVNINFAPVADVNSNPLNPIINSRSFGELPGQVAEFSEAYMRGLQLGGVMACVKHFPGHGNTNSDSHKTLPTIPGEKSDLKEVEMIPFAQLFQAGAASTMIAHLNIPAYGTGGQASSLSENVVTDLLRKELGFEGLVFTDGLNMKAVSAHVEPGELEVRALLAGNDVLLLPANVPIALQAIQRAMESGRIPPGLIEDRCKRVLRYKFHFAREPFMYRPAEIESSLRNPASDEIIRSIFRDAQTVITNRDSLLPLRNLPNRRYHWVYFNSENDSTLGDLLERYAPLSSRHHADEMSGLEWEVFLAALDSNDVVVASIHKSNASPWKSYAISAEQKERIIELGQRSNAAVLCHFANPYALLEPFDLSGYNAVLLGYQNHWYSLDFAAQVLFGARSPRGTLPVSIGEGFPAGSGLMWSHLNRLRHGWPAEESVDAATLQGIDLICTEGIAEGAMPGCRVLVARRGNVIYDKSFGSVEPDGRAVRPTDLYDLASITKIASTTLMLMKMVDDEVIDLNATLGDYDSTLAGTNKADLVIREVLAHQAGLKSWIPFYTDFVLPDSLSPTGIIPDSTWIFAEPQDAAYRISDRWWSNSEVEDSVYARLIASDLLPRKSYLYSDLGYYLLMRIIENHYQQSLDTLVQELFYRPLGAHRMTYNPLVKFPLEDIVPTENDTYFRNEYIRGYVHDPGTALLGGVGGHAGLFSDAQNLAVLMQMYLNGGTYGGQRFLSDSVISEFTRCQYCDRDNRRGIGFDKPVVDGNGGPTCNCVSLVSFGHTGFTGTLAWVDPEEDIVYIFLSNRICPSGDNRKLIDMDIRTRIQEVIYNAIN